MEELIEEQQEKINELYQHFSEFVQKKNFKNYEYVVNVQKQVIASYQEQLKALIDVDVVTPTHVESAKNVKNENNSESKEHQETITVETSIAEKVKPNKLCPFFKKGNCKKGEKCNYLHKIDDVSSLKQKENQSNKVPKEDAGKLTTSLKRNATESSDVAIPRKLVKADGTCIRNIKDTPLVLAMHNIDPEWNSPRLKSYLKKKCGEVAYCDVTSGGSAEVKFSTILDEEKAFKKKLFIGKRKLAVVVKGSYFLRLVVTGLPPQKRAQDMLRNYFKQFAVVNSVMQGYEGQFYVDLQIACEANKLMIISRQHFIGGGYISVKIETEEDLEKIKMGTEEHSETEKRIESKEASKLNSSQATTSHQNQGHSETQGSSSSLSNANPSSESAMTEVSKYEIGKTPLVLQIRNLHPNVNNGRLQKYLSKHYGDTSYVEVLKDDYTRKSFEEAEVRFKSIEAEEKLLNSKKLSIEGRKLEVSIKGEYLLKLQVSNVPSDNKAIHSMKKWFSKFCAVNDITNCKNGNFFMTVQIPSKSDKEYFMSREHFVLHQRVLLEVHSEGYIDNQRKKKVDPYKPFNSGIQPQNLPSNWNMRPSGNMIANALNSNYSPSSAFDSRVRNLFTPSPYTRNDNLASLLQW